MCDPKKKNKIEISILKRKQIILKQFSSNFRFFLFSRNPILFTKELEKVHRIIFCCCHMFRSVFNVSKIVGECFQTLKGFSRQILSFSQRPMYTCDERVFMSAFRLMMRTTMKHFNDIVIIIIIIIHIIIIEYSFVYIVIKFS